VKLLAAWTVIDMSNETALSRHRFERSIGMTEDGYDALVEAHKSLLSELAVAIAASLDGVS
jgi:uncharacterized lipoprotein YmbA